MLAVKIAISSLHSLSSHAHSGMVESIIPAFTCNRILFFDSRSSFAATPILWMKSLGDSAPWTSP